MALVRVAERARDDMSRRRVARRRVRCTQCCRLVPSEHSKAFVTSRRDRSPEAAPSLAAHKSGTGAFGYIAGLCFRICVTAPPLNRPHRGRV